MDDNITQYEQYEQHYDNLYTDLRESETEAEWDNENI